MHPIAKISINGLTLWEAHDTEYAVELVVVIRVARLNILLTTVEDRFGRQQLGEDAPDSPDIYVKKFRIEL